MGGTRFKRALAEQKSIFRVLVFLLLTTIDLSGYMVFRITLIKQWQSNSVFLGKYLHLKIEPMNTFFRTLLLILIMVTAVTEANAQKKLDQQVITDLQKTPKYAFVLTTERHFKGVLSMYDMLIKNGAQIEDYEIVVKGEVVAQLVKNSELEAFFQKYKGKVNVSVCSVAMKRLGVTEETLFEGINSTPTASVRMLQLQANDYNTLTY